MAQEIHIEGARTHNLKNVHVAIPRGVMTVVTGVSGSGKSSLAFDTLYAEGQRRYVESMSTYARQFLERMQRPDVDSVTGVPPSIAIEQRNGVRNARSTVGTVTEISDYLRLLYARVGEVHCPKCDVKVARDTAQVAADRVLADADGQRVHVVARSSIALPELLRNGYHRLFVDGKIVEIESLDTAQMRSLPLCIDRMKIALDDRGRLADALYSAFALGGGRAEVHVEGGAVHKFDEGFSCSECGTALRAPEPALFSYNSPLGACETCQGFGRVIGIDLEKVVPDGRKTLAEGAIALFQTKSNLECQDDLKKLSKKHRVRLDVPWCELDERERRWVIDGDHGYQAGGWRRGQWYGVRGLWKYLETKKYKMHVRVLLARYRGYDECPDCKGTRLRQEALAVRVGERTIAELESMPVGELPAFLDGLALRKQARATAAPILRELESRLSYLEEVGVGYLSLIRQARTLSGGEAQRIALASALGAQLTGTLYVLDEPSVGLHPRDTHRLIRVLKKLVARGNTVVVVEHDADIMREADWVLDLGPGAGARGGELVFAGRYEELVRSRAEGSSTAQFLRGRERPQGPISSAHARGEEPSWLTIHGARAHNLKGVDVTLPIGRFSCLTGVSGSGKSSLLVDVLYGNAQRMRGQPVDFVGGCAKVEGLGAFSDVILVDQSPLARSSRSNPATYLKAMDELRQRFSKCTEAERLGLTAGAFSFNVSAEKGGGRCEVCCGHGTVTLEMHFLADVTVSCDACDGRRFGDKVLGVKWKGLSILDCLELTVDEALDRFAGDKKLVARLTPFRDVGLGYLKLGQPTATLSGGESQRIKLAGHLTPGAGPTLFLLDEPTTGLHGSDVEVLLGALGKLLDAGHTVVAIEHNLDFIRRADWLVDLGPEGGVGGGELVCAGTPDEVAACRASHTGRALAALTRTERRRG
ncbi:MAG: Excinuclease subunit [Myxococcales bacterium]|nr:Excinuclease subunit [Myxococcales bacterium]